MGRRRRSDTRLRVAPYTLDETEGKETASAVEGQSAGTYEGPGQPDWAPGVVGNALLLDGRGGHINCGQAFSPERTDAFSYGCWILGENEWYAAVLAKMDPENDDRGFDLLLDNSGCIAAHVKHQWPEMYLKTMSITPLPRRQWHHVLMTYDGSSFAAGMTIYVDGKAAAAKVLADRLSETIRNSVPLRIGTRDATYPFRGRIDDVRIYNRSLRAEEVSQLYKSGLLSLAHIPAQNRGPHQQAALATYYRPLDEPLRSLRNQLEAADTALRDAIPVAAAFGRVV
mgnify:CR=1 FL=1